MNGYLLDTCTFLWLTLEPEKLSADAQDICEDTDNTLLLSAVSVWEIELKYRLGKLPLKMEPPAFIRTFRVHHFIEPLPFTEDAALQHKALPFHHKDPFDRMLICQALDHDLILLTPDSHIRAYPVKTEW